MGPFSTFTGVDIGFGDIVHYDDVAADFPEVISVIDAMCPYGAPSAVPLVLGTKCANLCRGGEAATAVGPMPFVADGVRDNLGVYDGGIYIPGNNIGSLVLPRAFLRQGRDITRILWTKIYGTGVVGFNNSLVYFKGAGGQVQFALRITGNAQQAVTQHEVLMPGLQLGLYGFGASVLYDQRVHQHAYRRELNADGTKQRHTLYVDGLPVNVTAWFDVVAFDAPAAGDRAVLGATSDYASSVFGRFQRAVMVDASTAAAGRADAIVAEDYELNAGRFA